MTQDINAIIVDLGSERYCIEISQVDTLHPLTNITRIPELPAFVVGASNIQGRVIPIIDMHMLFAIEKPTTSHDSKILVYNIEDFGVGFVVDSTRDIISISPDMLAKNLCAKYMDGFVKQADGELLILINLQRILTPAQIECIRNLNLEGSGTDVTNI